MFKIILPLILLISTVVPAKTVAANDDMTSGMICPCECSMKLSTCNCPTAVQVNNEITHMKDIGFSEGQIFKVLQAEYGTGIFAPLETKSYTSLRVAGVFSLLILVFLGYLANRKLNPDIIPDSFNKKYEQRFEEEYRKFVLSMEET